MFGASLVRFIFPPFVPEPVIVFKNDIRKEVQRSAPMTNLPDIIIYTGVRQDVWNHLSKSKDQVTVHDPPGERVVPSRKKALRLTIRTIHDQCVWLLEGVP